MKQQQLKHMLVLCLMAAGPALSFAQACGIYRILYKGSVRSDSLQASQVYLPAPSYLEYRNEDSSGVSFVSAKLVDGAYELQLSSRLTTPYKDPELLLAQYKEKAPAMKMTVVFLRNGQPVRRDVEIPWKEISVSVIKDEKFGTLFEFRIKPLIL
jgi:hypothetical protein